MAGGAWAQFFRSSFEYYAGRTMERLDGLTDEEYIWEPVPGCWTIRRDGDRMVADWSGPPPDPPPVTTIAWRLHHICGFLSAHGLRTVAFERGEARWGLTVTVPATAADACEAVGTAISAWERDLEGVDDERLWEPLGPAAGPIAGSTVGGFVEHIHDEFIHHSAEVALLRDLYRAGSIRSRS